jgi:VanZ family protein
VPLVNSALSVPSRIPLRAGTYGLLAAGFLAFAVYGSWVPFHFRPLPASVALHQFSIVCNRPVRLESISDWTANVLLFVPIAFTLMATACVDRRWSIGPAIAPFVMAVCAVASTAIEFSQLYFPGRVSSLSDIVAQTIGSGIGVLGWLVVGQRLTDRLRRAWLELGTHGVSARLLPAYLAFLVLIHMMPFDLTLSPFQLYHKYREGRVHLYPFDLGTVPAWELFIKQVWNVLYFLPVGMLLARLKGTSWRDPRSWGRIAVTGLAMAALLQFAKLFVVSRNCEGFDVLVGATAVLAGWALSILPSLRGVRTDQENLHLIDSLDRRWLLAGWSAVLLLLNWLPFDFRWDIPWALDRLAGTSWVPFADYQQASPYQAFDQALHRILVFAPLGALLLSLRHRSVQPDSQARGLTYVAAVAAGLAGLIELGQAFLPDRYPSVTDVLLETGGAWVGALLYRQVGQRASVHFPPAARRTDWVHEERMVGEMA